MLSNVLTFCCLGITVIHLFPYFTLKKKALAGLSQSALVPPNTDILKVKMLYVQ